MDGLKKENFDLRLSLYFYEQRLNDMSSDSIDQALKEVFNSITYYRTLYSTMFYRRMSASK